MQLHNFVTFENSVLLERYFEKLTSKKIIHILKRTGTRPDGNWYLKHLDLEVILNTVKNTAYFLHDPYTLYKITSLRTINNKFNLVLETAVREAKYIDNFVRLSMSLSNKKEYQVSQKYALDDMFEVTCTEDTYNFNFGDIYATLEHQLFDIINPIFNTEVYNYDVYNWKLNIHHINNTAQFIASASDETKNAIVEEATITSTQLKQILKVFNEYYFFKFKIPE